MRLQWKNAFTRYHIASNLILGCIISKTVRNQFLLIVSLPVLWYLDDPLWYLDFDHRSAVLSGLVHGEFTAKSDAGSEAWLRGGGSLECVAIRGMSPSGLP